MANRLTLELVADANGLLKTMEQAQRQLNSFIKSADSAGQSLGGGVNQALDVFQGLARGGAAAAGVLAGGFVAAAGAAILLVESAGKQAEILDQTSQKTGIAISTLQSWTVAMAQSGLGMDTLTRGVKQLSDQIVQSRNPNSQAAEKFNQLGITATSVDGVLEQLADRFGMMPDGADKTRIAVEMFGKAGQDLIPILNKGSAGLRESMEASKRLGAVLSDDTVKSLAIADDAFDTLGVATRAAANQFAGLMAPAVGAVTESFAKGVGAVATFFGALNEGSKGGENTIQFLKTLNPLIQKLGGPGFNVEAMEKQAKDMASFGDATKQLHDELIAKLEAEGKIEEEKGMRLRSVHIAAYRDITAEMKAQEQLGRNQMEIEAHAQKDRNAAFGLQLQQQEELNNMQFAPATISPAMAAHEAAVENLIRLMPELNHQEAALQALFNAQSGHDTVVATTEAFKYQNKEIERGIQALLVLYPELSRAQAEAMAIDQAEKGHNAMIQQIADHKDVNKELELGTEYAKANYSLQEAFYRNAPGLIGQADLARQRGFELLQAENDLRRRVIDQTIFDEERKGAAIFALDKDLQAKRMGILNQFPTFWEQQLNAIVASNAFSLSSITSNFNNATAQWIQGQGDFTQFWQQTQTTLLTSALQFTEQWLVQLALAQLKEIAMVTTQEATKTSIQMAGDAARVASNATANAAMEASNVASATASTSIWGSAVDGISGFFGMIGSGFSAVAGSLVETVIAAGTFIMTVLSAVAEALSATVFGIPFAGAIVVGIGLIAAALAMTDNLPAFAHGGIVSGPTVGLMGEAGSPEAAIPLNDRGAAFMQKAMGFGGGSGPVTIVLQVDRRTMAKAVVPELHSVIHTKLGYT